MGYIILGGALGLIEMLFSVMAPLTAQRDKVGEIVCTKFTVVDERGR